MITWLSKHRCATLPSSSCRARRGSETDTPTRRVPASLLRRALGRFKLIPSQALQLFLLFDTADSWRSLLLNNLWAWSATGTGRRTLSGSASGKIRRCGAKLYFKPAKHLDDNGDKCNPIPLDIQTHISKTTTWCWVWGNWGILIRNSLKVVSAKRSNVERVCDNGENSLLRLFIYKYLGIINICIRQI